MGKSVESPIDTLKQFFEKATKIEAGKELIKRFNFTFQFHVSDGEDFYLEIKNGGFKIERGKSPEKNVDCRTLLGGNNAMLTQLFKGQIILWDKVWEGKLQAECYGPSQGYVSWLSQFLKIGRREKSFSEFFNG
jgi:hypothetical protein